MTPAYVAAAALAQVAVVISRSRPAAPAAQIAVVVMIVMGVFSATLVLVFLGVLMAAWVGEA